MQELLKFSSMASNSKLKKLGLKGYTFSIPSGHTCPSAKDCLSKAVLRDGTYRIQDGKETKFRCFSATQEVAFPAVRKQRQYNYDVLKRENFSSDIILKSLPKDASLVRIHVAGDFQNEKYFKSWLKVATENPNVTFYAYTKQLKYWISNLDDIPNNFKLNASRGGKDDVLIDKYNLKSAEVVFSEQEALNKGLEIDYDDSHAFTQDKSFGLLIHGTQPKDSSAAKALKELKSK